MVASRLVLAPPTMPSHVSAWRFDMEDERDTGRACTGLWRWVWEEEDDDEEEWFVSSPWEDRLRLDLDVTDRKRLLELVLVLRRKCSSKSGRPRGRENGEE